jgi:hypothetical protein
MATDNKQGYQPIERAPPRDTRQGYQPIEREAPRDTRQGYQRMENSPEAQAKIDANNAAAERAQKSQNGPSSVSSANGNPDAVIPGQIARVERSPDFLKSAAHTKTAAVQPAQKLPQLGA